MSNKATAVNGTVIAEQADITYKIGSETLGSIAKACDKALTGMNKGEMAELKCVKENVYEDKPAGVQRRSGTAGGARGRRARNKASTQLMMPNAEDVELQSASSVCVDIGNADVCIATRHMWWNKHGRITYVPAIVGAGQHMTSAMEGRVANKKRKPGTQAARNRAATPIVKHGANDDDA
eukprot:2462140-Prorocentrum_lima.AAC.1